MPADYRVTASALSEQNPRRFVISILSLARSAFRLGESRPKKLALTPGQQLMVPLDLCLSHIENEGFHSFFASPVGSAASEMRSALRRIGANKANDLVAKAFATFPGSVVPRDIDRRRDLIDRQPEALFRHLDQIERRFFPLLDAEVFPLAADFIRAHTSDFLRDIKVPPKAVLAKVRSLLGRRVMPADPKALERFAALGVPEDVLVFYRLTDWRGGFIEHRDARLRDLRTLLTANRSAFRQIACAQGFVTIADTRTERNAYTVATARQTRRPVGSIWLFSSRKDLYRSAELAPSFAQPIAPDFAGFLRSFFAGTLKTVEFIQPRDLGKLQPTWRSGR